jgi:hypothetical protein
MRTRLTAYFKSQLLGPDSGEVGVGLIDIYLDGDLDTPAYRVCDNNEDITSNGNTYTAYAFELAFVDEMDGEIPAGNVVIDNTDPAILLAILQAAPNEDIILDYQFVIASDPDNNQLSRTVRYYMSEWHANEHSITGSLVLALINNENFPRYGFTPDKFPGLFGLGFGNGTG